MPNITLVHLGLSFADAGRSAEEILGMYTRVQMIGDLDQLAWNLVGCDDERQAAEIGRPRNEMVEVKPHSSGGLDLEAVLSFTGINQALIEKAVEEYAEGFEDYIRETVQEYEAGLGIRTGFVGRPISRSCSILKEGKNDVSE